MTWYCAHIILSLELRDRPGQRRFVAWENLVLVSADSPDAAREKAEDYGRREAAVDDETLTWDGEPAHWVFAGVRKLVECQVDSPEGQPSGGLRDGTEVSYNQLILQSGADVSRLAAGESLEVFYDETPLVSSEGSS